MDPTARPTQGNASVPALLLLLRAVVVSLVPCALLASSAIASDLDYDGMVDAWEDSTLQAHAPHLWLFERDDRRPCGFEWFVKHSRLTFNCIDNLNAVCERFSRDQLADDPGRALELLLESTGGARPTTSDFFSYRRFPSVPVFVYTGDATVYTYVYLDLDDDAYNGEPLVDILTKRNVGLYGHVAPLLLSRPDGDAVLVAVQYYQLFAFNDFDYGGPGNHEGDWNMFEVFLDSSGTAIAQIWYAHGKKACRYLASRITEEELKSIRGRDGWDAIQRVSELQTNSNIYVGYNDHEFYPEPTTATNAALVDYQTQNIPNVGEIAYPRAGFDVLLRYNGFWGTWYSSWFPGIPDNASPEGIMHNTGLTWQWPTLRCKHIDWSQYWIPNSAPYPAASYGYPLTRVQEVVDLMRHEPELGSHVASYIIMESGSYRDPVRVDVPAVLVPRGGPVTLGK